MAAADLTAARVRELLTYEPETGVFRWRNPASNRMKPGQIAGSPNNLGYVYLTIDGRKYRAHRVAWLVLHGLMPTEEIDHINGNRADNRAANLRLSDRASNMLNQRGPRADNRTGVAGVKRTKSGRFIARFAGGGKTAYLGTFDTVDDAAAAYAAAKSRRSPQ